LEFLSRYQDEPEAKAALQEATRAWKLLDKEEQIWLEDRVDYFKDAEFPFKFVRPAIHVPIEENHPVLAAIGTGDLPTVNRFLAEGGSVYSVAQYQGLAERAIEANQLPILKLLHQHGLDFNRASRGFEDSPLILALKKGCEEMVRYMLENGADPNRKFVRGRTVFTAYCSFASGDQIAKLLIDRGADPNDSSDDSLPFVCASYAENIQLMELLLSKGANLEWQDSRGKTPLILAAQSGKEKSVRFLLQHGADINARDKEKKTALTWAKNNNHSTVVAILEKLNS